MKVIMIMTARTKMGPCGEREVSEYLQEPHGDVPGIVTSCSFLTLFIAFSFAFSFMSNDLVLGKSTHIIKPGLRTFYFKFMYSLMTFSSFLIALKCFASVLVL